MQWNGSNNGMKWPQWSNEMVSIMEWNTSSDGMKWSQEYPQQRNEMASAI